jgi:hypothetical protein
VANLELAEGIVVINSENAAQIKLLPMSFLSILDWPDPCVSNKRIAVKLFM